MKPLFRVLRVLEYVGTRAFIDRQMERSIHGVQVLRDGQIRASTVGVVADPAETVAIEYHDARVTELLKANNGLVEENRKFSSRNQRQSVIFEWGTKAFGADQMTSIPQRAARFLEEAIELAQACDLDKTMAHKLIDYIYDRPPGERRQELGGVGVTVMALAEALGESADECEAAEVERVLSKPTSHFTERNKAKNDAGFYALSEIPACHRCDRAHMGECD
jgi:NTP pyrophosphatase (non-canonical NTP hydrolase)